MSDVSGRPVYAAALSIKPTGKKADHLATPLVFASRSGGGMLDTSQVLRMVRAAAASVDIEAKVSCHWLRHAHASHSLDWGAPISLVQATLGDDLGHSSMATTGRYTHAGPSESSGKYLAV